MEKVHRKLYGLPDVETDWGIESICHRYVDNETFIFKEFSAHGYKTIPSCVGKGTVFVTEQYIQQI
ncbi:hypothetical protein OESDEN_02120 [Oesophagostomum dentatum]|uniref:Uncharacterized protein n=1 Tax=Oesophagostomum dentatum TaxID=61180 RepID=A0A0B1TKU9_OESDE|nr:hypothetical protein OESDEN_02120 [Oesophagostomum dentatum]